MGYSARTLVEAVTEPAALVGADGRVVVANDRWRRTGGRDGVHAREGTAFPGTVRDHRIRQALLDAILSTGRGDDQAVVHLPAEQDTRTVRIMAVECDCGTPLHLIKTEPRPEPVPGSALAGASTSAASAGQVDPLPVATAKSEFLALLGHEIRTPVTGVVGMVDLLRALPLDQDVREVVDGVHRSTQALKTMIDDLLDLARLETGHLDLAEQPCSLRGLLEGSIDPLQQQARQKGILLLAALAPDAPTMIVGDADRLRQVLANLVGNAVKFTTSGEVVATAQRGPDGRLVIEVSDTGPGLDDRDKERILAPFVRADSTAARTHEGAGLGLAIAARLVARMGGEITVGSTPGHGSQFRVVLPLVPAATTQPVASLLPGIRRIAVAAPSARSATALTWILAAAGASVLSTEIAKITADAPDVDAVLWCDDARDETAARRADEMIKILGPGRRPIMISPTDPRGGGVVKGPALITSPLTLRRLVAAINSERTGVRGAPISVPPFAGGRVLLAEDNDVNRGVFRRMIELLRVQCDTAPDGEAAVRAVLDGPPYDVILMDVQMPRVDGLEATRRIRSAGVTTPILALTATALRGDRERCIDAGMTAHLQKPITLPELRTALARYLAPPEQPAPPPVATNPVVPEPITPEPVMPPGPAHAALNLNRLRTLEEELADRPLVLATISTFLAELDGRRAALAQALDKGDVKGLRAMAHTLKSSSALLGAETLAAACSAVEHRADATTTQELGAQELGAQELGAQELAALVAEVQQAAEGAQAAMTAYVCHHRSSVSLS